jgi:hypothetical protein
MSVRLVATIVAEGVALDSLTGRITAFNMLEQVFAARLPALLPKLVVITIYELTREPDAFFERVRLIAADGTELVSSITEIRIQGREPNSTVNGHRSLHTLWGIRLPEASDLRISVERAPTPEGPWAEIGSRIVTVIPAPHPLAAPMAAATKEEAASAEQAAEAGGRKR